MISPLFVRPNCNPGHFEIIAGKRRYFASLEAARRGQDDVTLPCITLGDGDDAEALEISMIENMLRQAPDQVTQWESYAHEVSWGSFNALEQFCCTNGIAYHRGSGSCPGSFGAERIIYDGQHGPFNYSVDEDDHVVLHEQTIVQLGSIRAIRAYLKPASLAVPPLVIAG